MDSTRVTITPERASGASLAITKASDSALSVPPRSQPQRAQASCAGSSRQMGGMWQTNRFFVRRQFS
jgi:hypothetical protein